MAEKPDRWELGKRVILLRNFLDLPAWNSFAANVLKVIGAIGPLLSYKYSDLFKSLNLLYIVWILVGIVWLLLGIILLAKLLNCNRPKAKATISQPDETLLDLDVFMEGVRQARQVSEQLATEKFNAALQRLVEHSGRPTKVLEVHGRMTKNHYDIAISPTPVVWESFHLGFDGKEAKKARRFMERETGPIRFRGRLAGIGFRPDFMRISKCEILPK